MTRWRFVAPAGAPIGLSDLGRWVGRCVSSNVASEDLVEQVCRRFGIAHCRLASTGRAGLTLLLRAMRQLAPSQRDEVVLPAYTCYSVAASVIKAGLKPRLIDVVPETLDFAPSELAAADFSRVLAVVATNLFGLPNDMRLLTGLAEDRGVFLVDDSAQAMGATIDGRWSGTWGDAGLFSFDKGKNVSAIDGGVIVSRSDQLVRALDSQLVALPSSGLEAAVAHTCKVLAYAALLRPELYGIPARIPQLGLGKTVFTTTFPLAQPDPLLVALAAVMFDRLDTFTAIRRANAEALLSALDGVGHVTSIRPVSGASPVYLRLPILLPDAHHRQAAIAALVGAGIGATASYPACLADVPAIQPHLVNSSGAFTGGRALAARLLTLPTHPFVTAADVTTTASVLQQGAVPACAA